MFKSDMLGSRGNSSQAYWLKRLESFGVGVFCSFLKLYTIWLDWSDYWFIIIIILFRSKFNNIIIKLILVFKLRVGHF